MAINILLPCAGAGKRFSQFGYTLPKLLIDINGIPMIKAVLNSINLEANYIFITRKYEQQEHNDLLIKTLKESVKNPTIISIPKVTRGAAETCLYAKSYINNNDPLIITNCDQIFQWDVLDIIKFSDVNLADGSVAVFKTEPDTRYSYISVDENNAGIELTEKIPISELALNGLHFWKKGSDFVRSAETMIINNDTHSNEFYVSKTYNYLIKEGKKIMPFLTTKEQTCIVGTPEQLQDFLKNEST